MDPEVTTQTYTVVPVLLPILPASSPYLDDPTGVDAVYNTVSGNLTVSFTLMIPSDLNPNELTINQFYSALEPNKLCFYAVYTSTSSVRSIPLTCWFRASALDAGGAGIDLGAILSIYSLMVNTVGPKSSRGLLTTVRTTED